MLQSPSSLRIPHEKHLGIMRLRLDVWRSFCNHKKKKKAKEEETRQKGKENCIRDSVWVRG